MRTVIAADSLALPRPAEQGSVRYHQTYGYLVQRAFAQEDVEIIIHGRRGNTILFLNQPQHLYDEVLAWEPDVVIIHIGIVDCAPRVFSQFERTLVNRIRPISMRDALIRFVGRHRRFLISHFPQKVYVPLSTFETNYEAVVHELQRHGIQLLLVNICPTDAATAFRSPGLSENICLYNEAIARRARQDGCSLVDIHAALQSNPEEYLLSGIHLNPKGNKLLADLLVNHIQFQLAIVGKENL